MDPTNQPPRPASGAPPTGALTGASVFQRTFRSIRWLFGNHLFGSLCIVLFASAVISDQVGRRTDFADSELVKDVESHGNHLTTGFLGTPFLLFVLEEQVPAEAGQCPGVGGGSRPGAFLHHRQPFAPPGFRRFVLLEALMAIH